MGWRESEKLHFSILKAKKDERAAKNAKKGSVDSPLITPSPSEEEEVEYGDKMPKNWFCPHLLCFKMFRDDPVLKLLNNARSAKRAIIR
jgi:hypothetical protein